MCPNLGQVRTLVLMRHAKSAYPDGLADHERPLAPRGEREATLAGDWLRENLPTIGGVLCSSAVRTRQTLARTMIDAPTSYLDTLYGATPGTMLAQINGADDTVPALLVVGHEPTVSQLALGLSSPTSDRRAAARITEKYPTSGIAVFRVPGSWAELELAGAELVTFHVPR